MALFKKNVVDAEIERITAELSLMDPASDEYTTASENLERLMEAKRKVSSLKVSPDTWLVVLGGLLEVILILEHERVGYVSSKALNFVIKGRVK